MEPRRSLDADHQAFLAQVDCDVWLSAMGRVGGTTYCSSILPWRSCGDREPWVGPRHVDKTTNAVDVLLGSLPATGLVWGGDWNHALEGREYAGSIGGRTLILAAVEQLGLRVPTTTRTSSRSTPAPTRGD